MNKPLFLFVGRSASGKTTIANVLEEWYEHAQVQSYTTRPPRYEGEVGHIFLTDEDFDNLGDLVAYTKYNGFRYGTTAAQLDQCTIYVVDVPGVETLLERYNTHRKIVVIYFDTTAHTRINRMIERGDSDSAIVSRLLQDEKNDWFKQLNHIVWHYDHNMGHNVDMYTVNANYSQDQVLESVLYYMEDASW